MSKETQSVSVGFPIANILALIFVIAKLFGKITWSWVWVFSPLWISAIFGLTLIGVALLIDCRSGELMMTNSEEVTVRVFCDGTRSDGLKPEVDPIGANL